MMKRNLVPIAILIFVITTSIPGLPIHAKSGGKAVPAEAVYRCDTLSLTQEEYLRATQEVFSETDEDIQKIEVICKTFLALGKAYVRDPKAYDCTLLIAADSIDKNTVQYRLSEYRYLSALYEALEWEILWDDLTFADFKTSINDNHATATVVESYKYYLNNDFDKQSFRRRMYNFELYCGPDGWRITDVTTNDVHESQEGFQYIPLDVEGIISDLLAEIEQMRSGPPVSDISVNTDLTVQEVVPTSEYPYFWEYNPEAGVAYAEEHYEETSNRVFGYTENNNCQNFASQCVWAGLGGVYSANADKKALPAVSIEEVGPHAFNVWCQGQDTDFYDYIDFNWTWDNVQGFFKLMEESRINAAGPYGNAFYTNAVAFAQVGNVLAIDYGGAPAVNTLDHAMFVTAVTGTVGERTKYDVMVAAHTAHTETAYQTIAEYRATAKCSTACFARARIYGGYYPDPQ
jgi:hypothetical protein